jgi:Flp pilus assembly protein TadG
MIWRRLINRMRDESGAAMVEFSFVAALFFLLFFSVLDFGRLLYTVVHVEKAAQIAARIATTREMACLASGTALPVNQRPTGALTVERAGTSCDAGSDICRSVSFSCGSIDRTGQASLDGPTLTHTALNPLHPTVSEIWTAIEPLMPPGSDATVLNFRYDYDPSLGFLGGPYTPMVTVEFDLPDFEFVAPIAGLAAIAAGQGTGTATGTLEYPTFSVSLPAEDLTTGPGS